MARKEDVDYDIVGLQRTSSCDSRSFGNVGKIRPLHLHSIAIGPFLIDSSEVLQAGFVLLFHQLSASALFGTHRGCSIYYVLLTS